MQTLAAFALRGLLEHRRRTFFSALIISLGVAMTIAARFVSSALLATLQEVGSGDAHITHGFLVEQFDLNLKGISAVLMAAAAFLIFNTFAMTMTQHRHQLGLLRTLGMTQRQTLHLVLLEGLFTGSFGVLVGLLSGPLLGQGIVALLRLLAEDLLTFGAGRVTVGTLLFAAALGMSVTLLAVLIPAWRATKVTPLAALRYEEGGKWKSSGRPNRQSPISPLQAAALFILLALFSYLAIAPPGEWAQPPWNVWLTVLFVLVWLACLGVLLPLLLSATGRLARLWWGSRAANGRLAAENLNRAPGRANLTALTLAIGVLTIVGLTGFMTFTFNELFGYTFAEMARQEIWAVFPFDLEQGMMALNSQTALALPPEQIAAFLGEIGDRAAVTPIRFASVPELSFMGSSYFTFVAEPAALQAGFFTMSEGDWETAVPLMQTGCGALVAPAMAQRLNVGVGESFTLTGADGPVSCTLAGIGIGFVNASIVGSGAADQVGATGVVALIIAPHPQADLGLLLTDLQQVASRSAQSHLMSMRSYAGLMEKMIAVVGLALNGILLLAIVAAVLGVVNTITMSVHERRQELGLLRAMGATRGQVTAVVTGEAFLLGVAGGLFGLLAGAGFIVIHVVTYGGHSWGVPDLAVWPAALRSLLPALRNGLVGLAAVPLLSAAAARWPVRDIIRGTAVQTLQISGNTSKQREGDRRD